MLINKKYLQNSQEDIFKHFFVEKKGQLKHGQPKIKQFYSLTERNFGN
jgi:hypothetical protein